MTKANAVKFTTVALKNEQGQNFRSVGYVMNFFSKVSLQTPRQSKSKNRLFSKHKVIVLSVKKRWVVVMG
jgi:hypothetical protein